MGGLFVYANFLFALLFLFPIFLYVDSFVDVGENRAWFSVRMYRKFKLIGGYGELDKEGILIHVSKKKAFFLPYKELADTRKKFEIAKGFQLYTFRQTVETGGAEQPYALLLAAFALAVSGATFSVLQQGKPFLTLKNNNLLGGKPCLKLTTRSVFVFNGLTLAVAISKKILEAFLQWIQRRSIRSSKRQRSS